MNESKLDMIVGIIIALLLVVPFSITFYIAVTSNFTILTGFSMPMESFYINPAVKTLSMSIITTGVSWMVAIFLLERFEGGKTE